MRYRYRVRAWAIAVVLVVVAPRIADVARAPDIVPMDYELTGAEAHAVAAWFGFTADGTVMLELSQSAEHRARPDRDAALRSPDGTLPWELGWRVSTVLHASVTRRGDRLMLAGHAADVTTSFPHEASPRFVFASPLISSIAEAPGWFGLYDTLSRAPGGDHRKLVAGGVRATLDRIDTYDSANHAVTKWMVALAFGPSIAAAKPSDNSDGPAPHGGCR